MGFDNGLSWDTSTTWGQTKAAQDDNSGINRERAINALDVEVDPGDPSGQTLRCVNAEASMDASR